MAFSDFRTYDEIEPIPTKPKPPSFKIVWASWAFIAGSTITGVYVLHLSDWINLEWVPFWLYLGRLVYKDRRLHKRYMADLGAWGTRAAEHHERIMRQIQQYANRDWN